MEERYRTGGKKKWCEKVSKLVKKQEEMPLFPRLPLPHEFPIPAWLHKAGFKTGRTKFHWWEGKKLRRRLKTVRGGRISRFLRMYIYIARTFAQIEGPSLKLGGTERERERVRDRFSNGVKLPSVLTWMIIGRENFIESTYFIFLFFFLVPFSSSTRGSRQGQA